MKIAFISYEYPPDSAYGGIATYVGQAARMLFARGHRVEVFTSSPGRSGTLDEGGILVHRVRESHHDRFAAKVTPQFAARHAVVDFDVLEGPEYGADAQEAVRQVPEIPLVVKLHTPSFLLTAATYDGLSTTDPLWWRLLAGRTREYVTRSVRGSNPSWRYTHKYALDAEREHTLEADEIASPSRALAALVADAWRLDARRISHVPYPYTPSDALLNIPPGGNHNVVTFIGRLEVRKGVLDLARAIPLVLRQHPKAQFRIVGPDDESPRRNVGMREYLGRMLRDCESSVELLPPVPNERLAEFFATTAIVAIPSVWENFANVCLEAMAAARAIVASEAGGMAEMLDFGAVGRTIAPHDPARLAQEIIELLGAPSLRHSMGERARRRLLDEYNIEHICELQQRSYQRAVERRSAEGPRAY